MEMKQIGVLGCGLMGSGIAQVAAAAGCTKLVREVAEAPHCKGQADSTKSLDHCHAEQQQEQADVRPTLVRPRRRSGGLEPMSTS